jgi:hypothetical protein
LTPEVGEEYEVCVDLGGTEKCLSFEVLDNELTVTLTPAVPMAGRPVSFTAVDEDGEEVDDLECLVDGKSVKLCEFQPDEAGKYDVSVSADGFTPNEFTIDVKEAIAVTATSNGAQFFDGAQIYSGQTVDFTFDESASWNYMGATNPRSGTSRQVSITTSAGSNTLSVNGGAVVYSWVGGELAPILGLIPAKTFFGFETVWVLLVVILFGITGYFYFKGNEGIDGGRIGYPAGGSLGGQQQTVDVVHL